MKADRSLAEVLGEALVDPVLGGLRVTGLEIDSRRVHPGNVFFAYPGDNVDGRDYIGQAIERGAAAVVCEDDGGRSAAGRVPVLRVKGLRGKVGLFAARFFGNPGRDLFVVGITGTNGKTSCAHLLTQAFDSLDVRSGLIGTLGWGFLPDLERSALTTPDPVSVHRMLRALRDRGASHVCMEVSSHALAQGRVAGVEFDAALFTNLSHDHLDYHEDFEQYARAKAGLFESASLRFAVINRDDDFGRKLIQEARVPIWTYGLDRGDVRVRCLGAGVDGLELELQTSFGPIAAHPRLVGRINVHNILAVAAMLLAQNRSAAAVAAAIDKLRPVPGRMELFRCGFAAPTVVVDYAHTPDALRRSLESVREHCTGRLWCVFGCGGDRDRAKRPLMGRIAEQLADEVVVTDDNPRHEVAARITDEIAAGMGARPRVINDRARAIHWAIEHAGRDDWVLVAGKGHETTQQIGDEFIDLDDRSIVGRCLGAAA